MTNLDWLERIAASDMTATAATRTVVDAGGFRLLLDGVDDFPGVNWATPMARDVNALDVHAMIAAFQSHKRVPALEFIAEVHPDVPALLEAAGFRSTGHQDVMLVHAGNFANLNNPDVRVQFLEMDTPDDVFQTWLSVQARGFGFGADTPPTPEHVARLRDQIRAGRRGVLGWLEGQAVGAATILRPSGGADADLGELQGVTTLPQARRRGVAATLSSALVQDHLARAGRAVWLSVQDDGARACYAGIGFAVIGERCNYTLED